MQQNSSELLLPSFAAYTTYVLTEFLSESYPWISGNDENTNFNNDVIKTKKTK